MNVNVHAPFDKLRLSSKEQADAHIGCLLQYETADGTEYGRLTRATATQAVLARLLRTGPATFAPHPEPICPRSKNAVTFSRSLWILIPKVAKAVEVMDPVALPDVAEEAEEPMDPIALAEEVDYTK